MSIAAGSCRPGWAAALSPASMDRCWLRSLPGWRVSTGSHAARLLPSLKALGIVPEAVGDHHQRPLAPVLSAPTDRPRALGRGSSRDWVAGPSGIAAAQLDSRRIDVRAGNRLANRFTFRLLTISRSQPQHGLLEIRLADCLRESLSSRSKQGGRRCFVGAGSV